jgi:hypothetical protein
MRTRTGTRNLKRRRASSPLGRRIQRAGFTFHDVARAAGVTYRMVQYHMVGRSESPRVAEAIAKLLGEHAA